MPSTPSTAGSSALLQADSRTTMAELADKVGLSVSPCHRRAKLLEERGVITRYIATVDQKSLGLHVRTLRRGEIPVISVVRRLRVDSRAAAGAAAPRHEAVVMTGRTSPESGSGESGPAFPHVHAEIKTWTRGGPDDHEDDAEHGGPATVRPGSPGTETP